MKPFVCRSSLQALESLRGLSMLLVAVTLIQVVGCAANARDDEPFVDANPPAPGFDIESSDQQAIDIADRVMTEMGGRRAWDETQYLTWNFFGRRTHVWEKNGGDERIEFTNDDGQRYVILMNVNSRDGRVFRNGEELINAAERHEWLRRGYEMWVNDSYWLVMPYKLKDTGVTLKFKGEAPLEDGRLADVLQLTFRNVGVTPQNKYDVYVAKDTGLVEQWSYYRNATDSTPTVTTPWRDWKWHGDIRLSGDRGGDRQITEIGVLRTVPAETFAGPAPVDLSGYTVPATDYRPAPTEPPSIND